MLIKGLFSLPYRVLLTFLPLPLASVAFLALFPSIAIFVLVSLFLITLVGGTVVAIEAKLVRKQAHEWLLRTKIPKVYFLSFLIPLIFFVIRGAYDLYFRDAGELGMASFYLGIAHPTGFPFFMLASKGLSLSPVGSIFFRQNSLSFLSMALCIGIATVLARRWCTYPRLLWLLVPLFAVSSDLVWLHGCATEVYALSVMWVLVNIAIFQEAHIEGSLRLFLVGFFFAGLGFSLHITAPLEALVFGIPLFFRFLKRSSSLCLQAIFLAMLALLFGWLSTTYTLALTSKDIPIAFWHVSDLRGFFEHIFAQRIFESFKHEIGIPSLIHFLQRARDFVTIVGDLWIFIAFFLGGGIAMFRKDRWIAMAFFLVIVADMIFAIVINPMGIREKQTNLSFFILAGILCGIGVEHIGLFFQNRGARTLFFAICALLPFFQVYFRGKVFSDESPRPIAEDLLMALPFGAVVFTSSDDLSASIGALQGVEGQRPDVYSFVLGFVQDKAYVARQTAWHCVNQDCEELEREIGMGFGNESLPDRILGIAKKRDVFVEPGYGEVDRALRPYASPSFPAYKVLGNQVASPVFLRQAEVAMNKSMLFSPNGGGLTMSYCASFLRTLGVHVYELGFFEPAVRMTLEALKLAPSDVRTRYNLGEMMCAQGAKEEGKRILEEVVEMDWTYKKAKKALEKCR